MKLIYNFKGKLFIILFLIHGLINSVDGQTLNPSSISTNGTVNAIAQDSTSIYIGGNFTTAGYKASGVALINSEGKNALSFPSLGTTIYTSIPDGLGGWYIGGSFTYQGKTNLIHILSNNTVDVAFTSNTNNDVRALLLDGNNLYVAGLFTQISNQNIKYLATVNATTGAINPAWNPNPSSYVYTLAKDNNILYAGGNFITICGVDNKYFVAMDINTATAISSISTQGVVNVIKQDNDNLYLGGSFNGFNGYYTGDVALVSEINDVPNYDFPKISGITNVSVPDGSGGWYIGGLFSHQGKTNLIHILSNNTVDTAFTSNTNGSVKTLILEGSILYVGGEFTQIGGQNINYLAAVNPTSGVTYTSWNPNPNNKVYSLLKDGNKLYVGGAFTDISGSGNDYFATIDILNGSYLPSISTDNVVNTIKQDSNNVYLGGTFIGDNGFATLNSALVTLTSDIPDHNFPKINGLTITSIPDGNGGWYVGGLFTNQGISNLAHILPNNTIDPSFTPNPNDTVKTLFLDGNTLYVGGTFTQIDSQNIGYIASINSTSGVINASWNPDPNNAVNSIIKDGNNIYVGGNFTTIGNSENDYFAILDSTTGNPIQSISTQGVVNTINQDANNIYLGGNFAGDNGFYTGDSALLSNGSDIPNTDFPELIGQTFTSIPDGSGGWYVGGTFTYQSYSNLIHLLPNNTVDILFSPNPNGSVRALLLDGNILYVGGLFTQINGQNKSYLVAINASNGIVNTSWSPDPSNYPLTIAKDGDTIYVGGYFTSIGGQTRNYLASVDALTGLANVWNPNPNSPIFKLIINSGELLVGGSFTTISTQTRNRLAKFDLTTGVLSTWNPNANNSVNSIDVNGNSLFVGGAFTTIGGQPRNRIAEIDLTTGLATVWNPNANTTVNSVKLIGTTVYVGGDFTTIGGQSRKYLAAINTSDGVITSWDPSPNGSINEIKENNSDILITGNFSYLKTVSRNRILAISKTNNLITSWNPTANSNVNAIEISNSTMYVGGAFTSIGGQSRSKIAEIDLATGLATPWNPNANNTVQTIKAIGTTVYIGGNFTTIGGQTRNYLAAINSSDGFATLWNPKPSALLYCIASNGNTLCLSGNFKYLKNEIRNRLLAISKADNLITNWDPNPNSTVNTIEINGSSIYVGGDFTSIGGQPRNRISELDLTTGLANTWNPDANSSVNVIKLIGSTVYVGGNFTTLGGQEKKHVAALNATNGLFSSWNPKPNGEINNIEFTNNTICLTGAFTHLKAEDRARLLSISKTDNLITSWDPNPNNSVNTIETNGASVYVGGSFTTIGGQTRNRVAEVFLSTGLATPWNPNANNSVNSVKLIGTNVYIGGNFTTIGGQSRNYLAAINPSDGLATLWNPKPNGAVEDIKQSNQDVIVSGAFTFVNTEQRTNLLKISKADNLITSWNPAPNNTVQSIELNGLNGFFGGSFTSIGGQPRNRIAEVSLITGLASVWNPNSNNTVKTMKLAGSTLYVGGNFANIGGQSRNNLAALDITTGTATSWTPNPSTIVNKLAVSNNILYVAGNFTTIAGQTRNRLASFTTSDGLITTWNPDVSGSINDLFVTGSTIYIGGAFTQVSSQPRSYIASFIKSSGNLKSWKPILNGSVTSLISSGKFIYAAGTFTSSGGQACNGFTMINANTSFPELYFPLVAGGQINTMSTNSSQIYLGGSFTSINGNPYGGLASISYSDDYFTQQVDDYNPKKGGNAGDVTVVIQGNGFVDGTIVKLVRSGESDIFLQNLYIADGIQIAGSFDLRNVTNGTWDLVVIIPDVNPIIIPNGFNVEQGVEPDPWVTVVGFDRIRIGQWQSFNLVYGNTSNVDAHGVPVWFAVSDNAELDLKFELKKNYEYYNIPYDTFYDEIPNFTVTDTVMDVVGNYKLVGLYLPVIRANTSGTLTFKLKVTSPGSINVMSWVDQSYFGSPLKPWVSPCYDKILDIAFTFFPQLNCINTAWNTGYQLGTMINQEINSNASGGTGDFVLNASGLIATAVLDCTFDLTGISKANKLLKIVKTLNRSDLNRRVNSPLSNLKECLPPKNPPQQSPPIQTINSFDPNDKLGPVGFGSSNYLSMNKVLPYIIRCENAETATAAAQHVRIVDTLDQSVFDISSFKLGFISIRDSIINVPSGLKHYETDVDLRPENNIIARVIADLNTTTGVATWEFFSLDPATLLPTENPTSGFLPPNINKPEGEAAVMYTIETLDSITQDTQVKNKAYIYFDENPPIVTNEWLNTTDIIKPQSQMSNISVQSDGITIDLTWTGSDEGSGVRNYTIYYSTNGGDFEILANYVTETTFSFVGEQNNSYSFFTIATDNVGNVEDMKTMGEAEITLGINQNELFKGISVYPNPNQGDFVLFVSSKENAKVDLIITDLVGRVVFSKKQELSTGDNHIPLNIINNGIYILYLKESNNKVSKKVIIER